MLPAIFGGLTSLGGLLGANAAQRRAEQQRQQALSQMALDNDQLYQNTLQTNDKTIQQAAGTGGDAIAGLGRNLGANLASAGVYNSSATAGALAGAQRGTDTALANMASQLQLGALGQKQQGKLQIDQAALGQSSNDLNFARGNVQQARGGMGSFLGSLAQSNLFASGANSNRMGLPAVNGTVNQGDGLPGNASVLDAGSGVLGALAPGAKVPPMDLSGLYGWR